LDNLDHVGDCVCGLHQYDHIHQILPEKERVLREILSNHSECMSYPYKKDRQKNYSLIKI